MRPGRFGGAGRARRLRWLCVLAAGAVAAAGAKLGPDGLFRDVTKKAGIHFHLRTDMRRGKMIATMTGGCAFGDYDNDGWPDIYIVNSVDNMKADNTRHPEKTCGRLYRNNGDGTFSDVTERAGIRACGWGMGAFWADLDGDGYLDLYLTNVGPNQYYHNNGDGTFTEMARKIGLDDPMLSVGAGFLDFDGDGRIDVVVVNYLDSTPEWEARQPQFQLRVPEDYRGEQSHLYRQNADGTFTDVTAKAGLAMKAESVKSLGVAVLDYDGDGRPDLYFANDRMSNRLFHNRGDGTFEEVTIQTGAGVLGDHPRAGMGIAVGYPDGDEHPDILVTNFGGEPSSLYKNVEGQLFEDDSKASGVGAVGLREVKWGTGFVDFDNDGRPDLYVVGGHLAPRIVRILGYYKSTKAKYIELGDPRYAQPTVVLHNRGDGHFSDWTPQAGDLARIRMAGRGSATADYDRDGGMDLFIVSQTGPSRLFHNEIGARRHWLGIEPRPGPDRRTVLGAKVRITAAERSQIQEFEVVPAYASGSLVDLHFGLGERDRADRVEVRWPDGKVSTFENVPADRVYDVREASGLANKPIRGRTTP
jgi:enediyne biosynthesis protein E4